MKYLVFILAGLCFLYGCADVKTPTARYALTHPLSTKTMAVAGSSKGEILEKWGTPSRIIDMGGDETGVKKEAWVYDAWFRGAPLDFRHFSRRKKIYFKGGYVVSYEDIEDEH